MSVVSGGGSSGDGLGPRRLIVFNPNRILNTQSGPPALKELEDKLREWSPKFCFLSGSSAENPARQTWDEMKKVIPDLHRNCSVVEVASERIPMAVSVLEVLLEEHLSGVSNMQCMTIMVVTISPDPEFRRFVGSLVGLLDSDYKLSNKALAVLESKEASRGWSEAQHLQEDGWNLVNGDPHFDQGAQLTRRGGHRGDDESDTTLDYLRSYLGKPYREKPDNADHWAKALKEEDCVRLKHLVEEARKEYDNVGGNDESDTTLDYLRSYLGKPYREKPDNADHWAKALKEEDCVRLKHLVEEARKEYDNVGGDDESDMTLDYLLSYLGKPYREKPDNADHWAEALKEEDCVRLKHLVEEARKEYDNVGAEEDGVRQRKQLLRKGQNEYVVGSNGTIDWQKISFGRTAVHAAARRGDLKFLEFIVNDILHGDGYCSMQCNVLKVRHDAYKLDALAMAVDIGNQKIINFLIKISGECDHDPYNVKFAFDDRSADSVPPGEVGESTVVQPRELGGESMAGLPREPAPREKDGESAVGRSGVNVSDQLEGKLENITKDVLSEEKSSLARTLYYRDKDFNFLEINVYLFHFTFSTWDKQYADRMRLIREGIFSKISQAFKAKDLLEYLVHLKDGQGRTPLHVAVDSNRVKEFLDLLPSKNNDKDPLYELIKGFVNVQDEAGRTPLYRAAARNQEVAVKALLGNDKVSLGGGLFDRAGKGGRHFDVDELSRRNHLFSNSHHHIREEKPRKKVHKKNNTQDGRHPNFQPPEALSTALHIAIILKHQETVEAIVHALKERDNGQRVDIWCQRQFPEVQIAGKARENFPMSSITESGISTMKLAILVESIPILQTLFEAEKEKPGLFTCLEEERGLPSFHLAAAMGNIEVLQMFLDSKHGFDPTQVDGVRNTALHHAVKGRAAIIFPRLEDFVGCDYIPDWLSSNSDPEAYLANREVQRKLSIDLLVQVGVDIWGKNAHKTIANPLSNASDDFTGWWYDKTADETKQAQKKLSAATNAISVTAALVATASYLGPFTPPLGYAADSIQENILAVRVYVACNSLSFYFALSAIMLALLPALPLAQESVFKELARTRLLVAVALIFLFPSIVCILLAFAASYSAGIPDHGLGYHGFFVATTIVGGLLCLLVMFVFLDRLTKVLATLPPGSWKKLVSSDWLDSSRGSRSSDQSTMRKIPGAATRSVTTIGVAIDPASGPLSLSHVE